MFTRETSRKMGLLLMECGANKKLIVNMEKVTDILQVNDTVIVSFGNGYAQKIEANSAKDASEIVSRIFENFKQK